MFRVAIHLPAALAIGLALAQPVWAQEGGPSDPGPGHSDHPSATLEAPDSTGTPAVQQAPLFSWTDAGYAAAATTMFIYGVASTRTRILCAGPVTDQSCPQALQVSRTRTRPHLTQGLMATGLIGLAGYLHHRYDDQTSFTVSRSDETVARGRSLSIGLLAGGIDDSGVSVDLFRVSF